MTQARVWITWEKQRRSRGLSAALGARFHDIDDRGSRLVRYPRSIWQTLRILFGARGSIVFVQSPSIVLANLATTLGGLAGIKVVVDAHNGGIDPLEGQKPWLTRLARRALRKADLTIVTNQALATQIESFGAKAFVLPDPMPDFPPARAEEPAPGSPHYYILAICTWASDEPYQELLRAARLLPAGCELAITGRPRLTEQQRAALPANVRLTGFVSESDYAQLLRTADVIVDLTTRENCLLCGAYEAISVHKPLVVSDTAALRELLDDAALYCANDAPAIAAAINTAIERRAPLAENARRRDVTLRTQWNRHRNDLDNLLVQLATSHAPVRQPADSQ